MTSLQVSQNLSLFVLGLAFLIASLFVPGWGVCRNIITSHDCLLLKSLHGENLVKSALVISPLCLLAGLIVETVACFSTNWRSTNSYFRIQVAISLAATLILLAGILMATHMLGDIYSLMATTVGCGFVLQGFLNYFSMITMQPKQNAKPVKKK